jgi:hypothetical protein
MAGDTEAAQAHYRAAAARTTSLPEQRYLARQAARLKLDAAATVVTPRTRLPRLGR